MARRITTSPSSTLHDGGDEEAFAQIVKRYAGVVYSTSFRLLHDRGGPRTLSQDVFFRLLRRPQRDPGRWGMAAPVRDEAGAR